MKRPLVGWVVLLLSGCIVDPNAPVPPSPPSARDIAIMREFRIGAPDIWIVGDDGENQVRLTDELAADENPFWASNGFIYFNRRFGLIEDIWRVAPTGAATLVIDAVPLTGASRAHLGDYHENGGLLFITRQPDSKGSVWVAQGDGSGAVALTQPELIGRVRPTWSSDGTRIAWSEINDAAAAEELWAMSADGSNRAMLARGAPVLEGMDWHPQRAEVVVSIDGPDGFDLWVVSADGATSTRLTTLENAVEPAWSPDGSEVAYRNWETTEIFVIDATGQNRRALDLDGQTPTWSPDGQQLASCDNRRVATTDPDGTALRIAATAVPCRWRISYRP